MLATVDSNKFNHKNKIGEFRYTDIKDLVNNIKNNTISKIDAKKDLNTLKKIKNAEIIKHKKCISTQKKLLNLFNDLLEIILTDNENGNDNEDNNENDNENERKKTNDFLDKIIDKRKLFEDQIKLLKKKKKV